MLGTSSRDRMNNPSRMSFGSTPNHEQASRMRSCRRSSGISPSTTRTLVGRLALQRRKSRPSRMAVARASPNMLLPRPVSAENWTRADVENNSPIRKSGAGRSRVIHAAGVRGMSASACPLARPWPFSAFCRPLSSGGGSTSSVKPAYSAISLPSPPARRRWDPCRRSTAGPGPRALPPSAAAPAGARRAGRRRPRRRRS